MKLDKLFKQNRAFIICVVVVVAFFVFLMIRHYLQLEHLEKEYKEEIEDLREMVNVTNIGTTPELEYDIYQEATDFMTYYYGLSSELTPEYREIRLKELMTEEAFNEYIQEEYNNMIGCEITITDMRTYVDFQNSNKKNVQVCIFFNENVIWPKIDVITLNKYWRGSFYYDERLQKYVLDEIIECQELLTREDFNILNAETN